MFHGIGLAVVFYFYTRKVDPQQQLLALFYCITGVFLAPHTRIKKIVIVKWLQIYGTNCT